MTYKGSITIRAYPEDRDKLKEIARELSVIQKKDIGTPEVLRRTLNIPNLPKVLTNDAEMKRRVGK